MAITYEPIATITLGSLTYGYTLSSIPSTYTDLRLVLVGASDSSNNVGLQFNGDTSSTYSRSAMYGAATAAAERSINTDNIGIGTMSTTRCLLTADIFSYTGSTYKTSLNTFSNDTNGGGSVRRSVGLWRSTSAIDSIKLVGWFDTGTVISLYGIKAA